jgi:hypothetical protein
LSAGSSGDFAACGRAIEYPGRFHEKAPFAVLAEMLPGTVRSTMLEGLADNFRAAANARRFRYVAMQPNRPGSILGHGGVPRSGTACLLLEKSI